MKFSTMKRMPSVISMLALVTVLGLTGVSGCSSEQTAPGGGTSSTSGSGNASSSTSSGSPGGAEKCVGPGGSSSGGLDRCTATGDWKCGADFWDVECACPAAQCQCKKNGSLVKSVPFAGCKSDGNCDASLVPAGECGVPL